MKKRTKQKSRLTRKLCTSNEYEKIIKKIMLWFEMFFWHFLFLIEVLASKIIAVP